MSAWGFAFRFGFNTVGGEGGLAGGWPGGGGTEGNCVKGLFFAGGFGWGNLFLKFVNGLGRRLLAFEEHAQVGAPGRGWTGDGWLGFARVWLCLRRPFGSAVSQIRVKARRMHRIPGRKEGKLQLFRMGSFLCFQRLGRFVLSFLMFFSGSVQRWAGTGFF